MPVQRTNQYTLNQKFRKNAPVVTTFLCIIGVFASGCLIATERSNTAPPAGMQPPPRGVAQPETASFGIVGFYDTPAYAWGVDVSGGIAFVADNASGLQCINVTNPAAPTPLGSYDTPGDALDVCVSGLFAFVADNASGLQCINVTNPAAPTPLGSYDTPGYAYAVDVIGGVAYVADYDYGLQCINVTNPAAPTPLGTFPAYFARGVDVIGTVAYVVNGSTGLQCVNVSNPTAPTLLGSSDTPGDALDVCVSGTVAYVADGSLGLQCINVINPEVPITVGTFPAYYASGVAVSGTVAYVANGSSGLQCINVTKPAAPVFLSSYDTPGNALGVIVSGTVAFVADGDSGLQCVEIATLATPTMLSTSISVNYGWDVCVNGTIAYIAMYLSSVMGGGDGGIVTVDVSNPAVPVVIGGYDIFDNVPAFGVDVSGTVAYLARDTSGLECINVSNLETSTLLGSYNTPNSAQSVCVSGGVAYVADYSSLQCINVTNPAAPTFLGSYSGDAVDVCVSGTVAYVAGGGLTCINVSNPAAPTTLGYITTEFETNSVCVSGSVAFVAGERQDLQCFNVSDPANPVLLGNYNVWTSRRHSMDVSGGVIYLPSEGYLRYINVSNPAVPSLLASGSTIVGGYGICVRGSLAYVVDFNSGLHCIEVSYHEWDLPQVANHQAGDDTWRDTSGMTYDVDFVATSLVKISYVKYKICSAAGQGGTILQDWTNITTGINAFTYTINWPINFTACQEGTNYVSVRVFDYAGASQVATDAFYVRKDTAAPGITDNQANMDTWQSAPGATFDVDFADGGTNLSYAQYKICSTAGQGGTVLQDWTNISKDINRTSYTADWVVNFTACQEGTNYVSVRAFDYYGHEANATDVFYFRKDTRSPTIHVHTPAGTTYTTCPAINVTFADATSHLKHAYYKVDSLAPGGTNSQGWVSLFADAGNTSATIEFTLDAATWAGLAAGTHVVYIKAWDYANNVTEGVTYAWQFAKYTESSGDTDGTDETNNTDDDDDIILPLISGILGLAMGAGVMAVLWARSRKNQTRVIPPAVASEPKQGGAGKPESVPTPGNKGGTPPTSPKRP